MIFIKAISRRTTAHYKGELKDISRLILRGELKEGTYIKQFEERFAKYVGVKYAITVASGRLGLFLILDTLSLDKDSEVIMPSYTHESVPATVKMLGLEPIFVDIDRNTHNIDHDLIEGKIGQKTRAIIATHLFGRPCDISRIMEIAHRYKLIVIEDCAQSIGAAYNAQRVGSFGKAAYFSFGITKPLNTFGGGMITTDDYELYQKIKNKISDFEYVRVLSLMKNVAISYCLRLITRPFIFSLLIFPQLLLLSLFNKDMINLYNKTVKSAINFGKAKVKYTNMQALVGIAQLSNFDAANEKCIRNAKLLKRCLDKQITILKDDGTAKPVYYFFVVVAKDITALSKKLLVKGIDTGKYIMNDCAAIYGKGAACPVSGDALENNLQIPIYPELDERGIVYIADVLNRAYRAAGREAVNKTYDQK